MNNSAESLNEGCGAVPDSSGLLSAALEATGFEICEFGPEENESCERCDKPNQQLYYLRTDYWSEEGDYFCADCVIQRHSDNSAFVAQFEENESR